MGVKRKKLIDWDEVQAAEAVVAFYEKRLEEALEKLGRLLEGANERRT